MQTTERIFNGNRVIHTEFDSITDLCAAEVHAKNQDARAAVRPDNDLDCDIDWYGLTTEEVKTSTKGAVYTAMRDYITGGWAAGRERAAGLIAELPAIGAVQSIRRERVCADTGDELLPEVLTGSVPLTEGWVSHEERLVAGDSVCRTICVAIGDNCDVSADSLFWNGICAAVLAEKMEAAGYQVEVIGVTISSGQYYGPKDSKLWGAQTVKLKALDEPLDMDRLICAVAHAGFFRTFGFKAILSAPHTASSGLGRAVNTDAIKRYLELQDDAMFVSKIYTQKAAVEFLTAAITEQNDNH